MQTLRVTEATASQRRLYLNLVDATDLQTPETGEAGGQPQFSLNGGGWGNTSATLTHVGQGMYYVVLTAGELSGVGTLWVRYKSAATAECRVCAQVVTHNWSDVAGDVWEQIIHTAHTTTGSAGRWLNLVKAALWNKSSRVKTTNAQAIRNDADDATLGTLTYTDTDTTQTRTPS